MEATGESGYKEVLQVFINETEVITHVLYEDKEGNIQEIETTLNHRFMCEGEWKAAGTLKPGDLLTLAEGSQVPVTEVRFEDHHETVYNMEVEDYHTYYVGEDGVWVHNTYQGKKSTDFYVTPEGSVIPQAAYHSFSDVDVRKWYLLQEANIPDLIDYSQPLEQQAYQAFSLRNQYRTTAREMMVNRELAESLYWSCVKI